MKDISGRTAFITGGANGIGLGIARAFAQAGAKIALVDLDEQALANAQREFEKVTEIETALLDVRDRAGFARVADQVEARLGPVSLLFNNAGVAGGMPAGKMTYELWDWGMGVNLDGVINGIQTFLPRMVKRGAGGHIVNTASGAGLAVAGTGAGVLYHTAKYAVVGMAEALAAELTTVNIGVSVLCPGPVATGIINRNREIYPGMDAVMGGERAQTDQQEIERKKRWLERGASVEHVGQLVLDAVRTDQLYIHTDRYMERFIEARTKALLEAMPEPVKVES